MTSISPLTGQLLSLIGQVKEDEAVG